jgi:hypothetical protein
VPGIGKNAADGVTLDYNLPVKADTNKVALKIFDASGKLLRTYSNLPDKNFKAYPGGPAAPPVLSADKGLNRFVWDYRGERMPDVTDSYLYGDFRGRRVGPGNYRARLVFGTDSVEAPVQIIADPRLKVTAADWEAQQQFIDQIERDITDIQTSIMKMRRVRKQIEGYNELFKGNKQYEAIAKAGKEAVEKMVKWEDSVVQTKMKNFQDVLNFPPRLNNEFFDLRSRVDAHDPRVTAGVRERLRDLETQWSTARQAMQGILSSDVTNYNKLFKEGGLPAVLAEDIRP